MIGNGIAIVRLVVWNNRVIKVNLWSREWETSENASHLICLTVLSNRSSRYACFVQIRSNKRYRGKLEKWRTRRECGKNIDKWYSRECWHVYSRKAYKWYFIDAILFELYACVIPWEMLRCSRYRQQQQPVIIIYILFRTSLLSKYLTNTRLLTNVFGFYVSIVEYRVI